MDTSVIQQCRLAVTTAIVQSADPSSAVRQLMAVSVPHNSKFAILDASQIIADNAKSVETLTKLIAGLNILEKYGRHLLKPAENRSSMWRQIKFSNSIFRDRVDTLKGGRDIMHKMGYSVIKTDGVAFPDDGEPDHETVLDLVTDLVLLKKELETYLTSTHPLHEQIDQCLPDHIVSAVQQQSTDRKVCQHIDPSISASMLLGSNPVPSPNSPKPSMQQEQLLRQPAELGAIPKRPLLVEEKSAEEKPKPAEAVQQSNEHHIPSIRCDICGENNADFVCEKCDDKQLCRECEHKWHKHPKRQNHSLKKLRPDAEDVIPSGSTQEQQQQTGTHEQFQQNLMKLTLQQEQELEEKRYRQQQQQQLQQQFQQQQALMMQHPYHQAYTSDLPGGSRYRDSTSMLPVSGPSHNYMSNYSLPPDHVLHQGSNHPATSQPQHPYTYGYHHYNPTRSPSSFQSPSFHGITASTLPRSSEASHGPYIHGARDSQQYVMYPSPTSGYANMFVGMQDLGRQFSTNHNFANIDDGRADSPYSTQGVPSSSKGTNYDTMPTLQSHVHPMHQQHVRQSLLTAAQDPFGHQYNRISSTNSSYITTNSPMYQVSSPATPSAGSSSGQVVFPPKSIKEIKEKIEPSSKLLPEIKAVEGIEKRHSRLSVDLMTLRQDIETWNKRIDEIMKKNPDFFTDQEYIDLNKRKSHHLKEIDHLEAYKKELEIEEKNAMRETLHRERKGSVEELRMRNKAVNSEQAPPSSPTTIPMNPPSFMPEAYRTTIPVKTEAVNQQPKSSVDNCEHLHVTSIDDDEYGEKMMQELTLAQNPPSERNLHSYNIHKEASGQPLKASVSNNELIAAPTQNPIKHGFSEPNIVGTGNNSANNMVHNKSAADFRPWGCQHCTFINQPGVKVCSLCAKTSDFPIFQDLPVQNVVQCGACTFENQPGRADCEMCLAALETPVGKDDFYMVPKPVGEDQGQKEIGESIAIEIGSAKSTDSMAAIIVQPKAKARAFDAIISQDQDKVYWEKKEAQKRYEAFHQDSQNLSSGSPVSHDQGSGVKPTYKAPITQPAKISLEQLKADDRCKPKVQGSLVAKAEVKTFRQELNFADAIEQINLKREKEQMSIDGHQLIKLIKDSESAGYDISEVEIALKHAVAMKKEPLDWLKTTWEKLVDHVIQIAADNGRKSSINSVGDITAEEAREALVRASGDGKEAARLCVEERTQKYIEISELGEFAREEILTALFQNKGDVEESLNQLHQSKLQPFLDRIWTQNHGPGREAEMAAAAGVDESNSSLINSAVSHEEFQTTIRNPNIDKERRVRMVLVEGKLQSWGRAETVITILDKELPEMDLECSLPDIIEAVKNCGDRKSSLFYLNQECEICFSRFPMSKICNLGSCNCKICQGCVKQNFEHAVREKFVRNWGCPICQLPVLEEDEAAAASYFEFLSLLLQQHVSKEVLDLFEMRLRDWHLQKDPNFRWCAHCNFGFLYDRPDDPDMTCPTCKKKTCFNCKKEWEPQHEGRTCEEFTQFKIDNDPERQAKGIQLYLEENGIDCPSCKMRYSLAKGGCLHFKCPQCGHEFCSACSQPFMQAGVCKKLAACAKSGFHCHHPRSCFYYLRDNAVEDLQKLLKNKKVPFNTDAPPSQEDKHHCPVMEQKEMEGNKKDEPCGNQTGRGLAGLCILHYKEYLVGLINKHDIDPVYILTVQDMIILIENRNGMTTPRLGPNENEAQYKKRLQQFIIENIKLQKTRHR